MRTRISRSAIMAGALAGLAISVSSAVAARTPTGTVSHAINWQTPSHTIFCGVAPRVPGTEQDAGTGAELNGDWPGLQCGAQGIGLKHHGVGDPFVQLGRGTAGRAKLVYLSEDDLDSAAAPRTLPAGSIWSRDGITCGVSQAAISCSNDSGHGFTLSEGHFDVHAVIPHPS